MIANKEASRGFKSTGDVESYGLSASEPTKHGDEHVRQVHIALPTAIVSPNPQFNASQLSSNADHEISNYFSFEVHIHKGSPLCCHMLPASWTLSLEFS
jgi:hypothetical protein